MSVDSTSVGVEEATPSLMVDDFFQSAMHDFTGRARLESEDPRWSHLLRACASLRSLCGDEKELNAFMLRLVQHNPDTGNLMLLLEHTVSRIRQVRVTKKKPAPLSITQCCMALRLSRFVFNYLCAHVSIEELRQQLDLNEAWPLNLPTFSPSSAYGTSVSEGDIVVHSLLQELLQLCCMNPLPSWNTEVLFEALNLLITLCSTELYDTGAQHCPAQTSIVDSNIFLEYFFAEASRQHTDRLSATGTLLMRLCLFCDVNSVHGDWCVFVEYLFLRFTVSRDNAVSLCLAQALLRTGVAGFSDFEPTGARIVGALLKIISDRPGPDLDGASAQVVLMYGAKGHSDTDASAGVYASPVANILAAMPTLSDVRALQQTLWSGITMAYTPHFKFYSVSMITRTTAAILSLPFAWSRIYTFIISTAARARLNLSNSTSILPLHTSSSHAHLSASGPPPLRRNSSGTSSCSFSTHITSFTQTTIQQSRHSARQVYGRVSDSPLAQRGALFLLLLVHNKRCANTHNPFREALCTLTDEKPHSADDTQYENPMGTQFLRSGVSLAPGGQVINFSALLKSLSVDVELESHSVLLYSLLQSNPELLQFMALGAAGGEEDRHAFLNVLRCLYMAPLRSLNGLAGGLKHLYTLMILVLMCTHEEAFSSNAFRQSTVYHVEWYRERILRNASVGSICILCVLRMLTFGLHTVHDSYLMENTFAVLHNLGPHVELLHPYAAQRLVLVCLKLARRIIAIITGVSTSVSLKEIVHQTQSFIEETSAVPAMRAEIKETAQQSALVSGLEGANGAQAHAFEPQSCPSLVSAEAQQYINALQALCLLLRHALKPSKLIGNAHIVYHLVHQYREVSVYFAHPIVKEKCPHTQYILDITHIYYRLLRENDNEHSLKTSDGTIETLKAHMEEQSKHTLPYEVPDSVSFSYEEGLDPEAYFVPYVWEVIYTHTPDIGWHAQYIRMFDPHTDLVQGAEESDMTTQLSQSDTTHDVGV